MNLPLSKAMKLPLSQDHLENFVMQHIHAWSQEFKELNNDMDKHLIHIMRRDFDDFKEGLQEKFDAFEKAFEEAYS